MNLQMQDLVGIKLANFEVEKVVGRGGIYCPDTENDLYLFFNLIQIGIPYATTPASKSS